jgi:hypothetical protein
MALITTGKKELLLYRHSPVAALLDPVAGSRTIGEALSNIVWPYQRWLEHFNFGKLDVGL